MTELLRADPGMAAALGPGLVFWGTPVGRQDLVQLRLERAERGGLRFEIDLRGKRKRDVTVSVLSPLGQTHTRTVRAEAGYLDHAHCEGVVREVSIPGILAVDVAVGGQTFSFAAPAVDDSLWRPDAHDARLVRFEGAVPDARRAKMKRIRSPDGLGTGRSSLRQYVWRTSAKRAVLREVRVELDLLRPASRGRVVVRLAEPTPIGAVAMDRDGRTTAGLTLDPVRGVQAALWLTPGLGDDDAAELVVWAGDDARHLVPDRTS